MQALLGQGTALIVYSNSLSRRTSPSEAELNQQLALRLVAQTSDGALYGSRGAP
jgi:hypothetical protein